MLHLILCGGSGTRLWPLSRTQMPKQFVRLFGNGESLFQNTLKRNQSLVESRIIATGVDHYFLAVDQLYTASTKAKPTRYLLEPTGRNTAPAIALACMMLGEDEVLLVTPSDHLIKDQAAYETAVKKAKALAEQGYLVTFGIQPTYPETGFGYIEAQDDQVISFTEKPDLETATQYLQQGGYYWNSGMFCFQAGRLLSEMRKHAPEVVRQCEQVIADTDATCLTELRPTLEAMHQIDDISIDYAVMEKSTQTRVICCDIGWSDLGSFSALYDEAKQPEADNAFILRGDAAKTPICENAIGNLVVAGDRQVALLDVEDLVVVDTPDALLISHRRSAQHIRKLVEQVRSSSPELTDSHLFAHRPWGSFEVLMSRDQYKIKRIIVHPGRKLSLQKHFHRNEHWIVVSGTATVTVGDKSFLLRPNESTYIPMGEVHRLGNEGKIDLIMIEVQVGEYTGEDDIVRIADVYGR